MADNQQPPATGFTQEQKDELATMLGGTVNNMFTARLKTFEKQIHEKLGSIVAESLGQKLPELLEKFRAPSEPDDKDGKGGGKSKRDDVQTATLTKQLQEMNGQLEAMKRDRDAERSKNRQIQLHSRMTDELTKAGIVDPVAVKGAIRMLADRVGYQDEDGEEIVFASSEGTVDYSLGIKGWLKTPEAKLYLPPSGTRGSGSRPSAFTSANGATVTREQATLNGLQLLAEGIKKEIYGVETIETE